MCPDHPDKPTKLDIFSYFTLDDGTKYIQCIAGKKAIMPFIGVKEEELPRYAGEIYKMLEDKLYGHAVKVNADFIKNDGDLSLYFINFHLTPSNEILYGNVERNGIVNLNPSPYFTSLTFFMFIFIFFSPPSAMISIWMMWKIVTRNR